MGFWLTLSNLSVDRSRSEMSKMTAKNEMASTSHEVFWQASSGALVT
jgi:hypothetical protein